MENVTHRIMSRFGNEVFLKLNLPVHRRPHPIVYFGQSNCSRPFIQWPHTANTVKTAVAIGMRRANPARP